MAEMKHTDGGFAFPIPNERGPNGEGICEVSSGMTLRDYFAGQALAAGIYHVSHAEEYADNCYAIADAMLKARSKATSHNLKDGRE